MGTGREAEGSCDPILIPSLGSTSCDPSAEVGVGTNRTESLPNRELGVKVLEAGSVAVRLRP